MEQTKKKQLCVFKRNWKHYKTCYECGTLRKCERSDKPKWYARIIEQVAVWHNRLRINKELHLHFAGMSKKSVRRVINAIKKSNKQKQ